MAHVKQAAVVIPFYRDTITPYEAIALQQCFKVLANHPIIAIKPNQLTLPPEVQAYPFTEVVNFEDSYFKNIEGYNALMLSPQFYEAFLGYQYILIHQLDAFVFEDKLSYWCDQNYDYIGAPWLRDCDHPDLFKAVKSNLKYYFHIRYDIRKDGVPTKYQWENQVGNGGFSLRRVQKFHDLSISLKSKIDEYLQETSYHFNEDRFWSTEVNRKKKILNIPGYKKAVEFAFELVPDRALRLTNNQLPFGCHAWDRYVDFWKPVFKAYGYTL